LPSAFGPPRFSSQPFSPVLLNRAKEPSLMDMSFSAEDEAFRKEVQAFLAEKLPKDVAQKVHNGYHVTRPEIMAWR